MTKSSEHSAAPKIGAVLIGDELLSGRRQDKHMSTLIGQLSERGLSLSWVRMIGDGEAELVELFKQTLATDDIVFSYGGIGATPDDCTRQAVASALAKPLVRHAEGLAIMQRRFGADTDPSNEKRFRMVDYVEGARLIPNPVNEVPGFSIHKHHFVPGFPSMATPMVEWVLETEYAKLHAEKSILQRVIVRNQPESRFIELMEQVNIAQPMVRLSSLPNAQSDEHFIEFGITGLQADVSTAITYFCAGLAAQSVEYELLD